MGRQEKQEKLEKEKLEKEKLEKVKLEKEKQEKLDKEKQEKLEKAKLEKEKLEKEKQEKQEKLEKEEKEEKDRQTMLGLAKDSNTNHDEEIARGQQLTTIAAPTLATPFATVLTPQEIEEKLAAIQEEEETNEPIQDYLGGTGERKENRSLQQEQPSDSQPLILSFQDLMAREQALQA